MREILFRGKKVNKDKWIYGVPVKGTPEDESEMLIIESVFNCEEYFCRGCNFDPVIPESIGQFTGLTDKNGKKIFDGDIVKDEYGRILEVLFRDNLGKFSFKLIKITGEKWTDNFVYADIGEWFVYCVVKPKVIGNIYDNPELLKELQDA